MMVGSVGHVGWWCADVWHERMSARAHGHTLRPHKSAKINDLGQKHSLRVLLLGGGACPFGHGVDAQGGYNGDGWRHRLGALCHLGLESLQWLCYRVAMVLGVTIKEIPPWLKASLGGVKKEQIQGAWGMVGSSGMCCGFVCLGWLWGC